MAQLVEHPAVNRKVVGSCPTGAAIFRRVAQFGSVSDLGSEGRKFESCLSDQAHEVGEHYEVEGRCSLRFFALYQVWATLSRRL